MSEPATAILLSRDRSAVVTFSSRGSPATTFTRPPRPRPARRSRSPLPAGDAPAKHVRSERLRRLHRPQPVADDRLDDASVAADTLQVSDDRQARHGAVPALGQRREHALDHVGRNQRPRGVVDEDTTASSGTSASPARTESRPRLAARDAGAHLVAADSSASRIAGSSHPAGATTTIASTQLAVVEPRSGSASSGSSPRLANALGRSSPESFPSAGSDEDRPDGHLQRRLLARLGAAAFSSPPPPSSGRASLPLVRASTCRATPRTRPR